MAGFNFIDAAGKSYKFVWRERQALAQLAGMPVLFKIATFTAVAASNLENNPLRQGLLLLPAYFLEGWLVAQVIRFAIFGERWQGAKNPSSAERKQSILAATIIYLLLKLVSSLFAGAMLQAGTMNYDAAKNAPDVASFFLLLLAMTAILWGFRFFWIYIPAAMGYPVARYLKKTQAFSSSLYILGLWLVCMIPPAILLAALAQILGSIFPPVNPDTPADAPLYIMAALQAVAETLIAIISSVGMAYGARAIITGENLKNPLF